MLKQTTESAINQYINESIEYKLCEWAIAGDITYLRYVKPGTQAVQGDNTENQPISAIKRIDAANKTITWANGSKAFNQIWANRAALTYKFL